MLCLAIGLFLSFNCLCLFVPFIDSLFNYVFGVFVSPFCTQSPLGGWLYPGLAATAATAGGFSSSAGRGPLGAPFGAPISPHGTPLASGPTGAVTTLASPLRRTTPGLFPSPMVIEFLRPLKMVNFAVQYLLSFRFYFMFMARTTFQVCIHQKYTYINPKPLTIEPAFNVDYKPDQVAQSLSSARLYDVLDFMVVEFDSFFRYEA